MPLSVEWPREVVGNSYIYHQGNTISGILDHCAHAILLVFSLLGNSLQNDTPSNCKMRHWWASKPFYKVLYYFVLFLKIQNLLFENHVGLFIFKWNQVALLLCHVLFKNVCLPRDFWSIPAVLWTWSVPFLIIFRYHTDGSHRNNQHFIFSCYWNLGDKLTADPNLLHINVLVWLHILSWTTL